VSAVTRLKQETDGTLQLGGPELATSLLDLIDEFLGVRVPRDRRRRQTVPARTKTITAAPGRALFLRLRNHVPTLPTTLTHQERTPSGPHERPVAGRPCATPRRSGAHVTEPVTFRYCAASPAAHVSRPADRRGDPRARTRSRGPAAVAGDPLPHRTRRCGGRDRRLGPTALTSSPASSVMSQSRDETLALVA
jgi:hypothetical protein